MSGNIESIKTRLRNYSKKRNKVHQFTIIRFFQERLLYRLSISGYQKNFLLKGGALIYSFNKEESRPTLDIDLLADKIRPNEDNIKRIFEEICSIVFEDGVIFESDKITTGRIVKEGNYSGIRVKVKAWLGNINQIMQIDIGYGDVVTPAPVLMEYPTLLDLESPKLLAYSVESLIAEKFEAMIKLGDYNSRMKDFYDVYTLLIKGQFEDTILLKAVANTLKKERLNLLLITPFLKMIFMRIINE